MNARTEARKKLHTAFQEGTISFEKYAIVELILWNIRPGCFWPTEPTLVPKINKLLNLPPEKRAATKATLLWLEKSSILTFQRQEGSYKKQMAFPDIEFQQMKFKMREKPKPQPETTSVVASLFKPKKIGNEQLGGSAHPSSQTWEPPKQLSSQATPQQVSQLVTSLKQQLEQRQNAKPSTTDGE